MTTRDESPEDDIPVVRLKHPWRVVGVTIVLLIAALFLYTIITNPRFQWDIVFRYLFDPKILAGLGMTITLTVVCISIGLVLGVILAVMRVSQSNVLRTASGLYLWFFRGTPVLVQLVFWYNLGYLFPKISIGLPGMEPFLDLTTNDVITPLTAAIFGLGLNEGAYLAEIIRAGILSVAAGQHEAATSIGMSRAQSYRRIVLPQAMRVIIPPTGNETIGMLKMTSLVSVIALSDLMYSAQAIYSRTFEVIPLLITVSIWYLFLTSVLSIGQGYIERYFGKGVGAGIAHKSGRSSFFRFALSGATSTGGKSNAH